LEDYEKSGAVRRVSPQGTLHLLPWFLISKPEEGGDQMEVYLRLSRNKSAFSGTKVQAGSHPAKITPYSRKIIGEQK